MNKIAENTTDSIKGRKNENSQPARRPEIRKKTDFRKILAAILYPVLSVAYLETVLHILTFKSFGIRSFIPILFSIPCGVIIYYFSTFFKEKANKVIYCVLNSFVSFYFIVHFVYYSIFGSFMSLYQIKMGAEAVTNFFDQMMYGISRVILSLLLFLVPTVVLIVFYKKKFFDLRRPNLKKKLVSIPVIFAIHFICLGVLAIGGTKAYSPFDIYFDNGIGTDVSVENLGIVTTTRLELANIMFPGLYPDKGVNIIDSGSQTEKPDDPKTDPKDTARDTDDTRNDPPEKVVEYNTLDIDFDKLIADEDDKNIKALHKFFASRQPTAKNEYTGYFKGYNLITFCAESFSPYLVSEELTPTLYKMINNGFVFTNYFGSYESNTTNGEYTFCMGNFPDFSREKKDNSFIASMHNSLPFTLGNAFIREYGVQPYAFHNYYGSYYQRMDTHPNMGYIFKCPENGLNIEISWPSSDLEMMQKSMGYYINDPGNTPFHAYYMTFSGHFQYNWNNPMAAKNRSLVKDLPYKSETVLSYIAANLELEKALAYTVQRLEEEGIADKTVIVLSNDHYPYGLKPDEYNELAGKEIDLQFEKYRNSFICWCPSMKEPVVVDAPCCTIDILPTLLNLFGMEYDSRLLCGIDVLDPDAQHIAILANQSFITPDVRFSSSNNNVEATDPSVDVSDIDVTSIKNYVKNIFTVSTAILEYDYYSTIEDYLK